MSFFFFYKIVEQEGKTGPAQGGGWYQWEGEVAGKRGRRMNKMQKLCTHVCKCKNSTCWNYSRNGEQGVNENNGWGEFKYDILDTLLRTFINATMYPLPSTTIKKKNHFISHKYLQLQFVNLQYNFKNNIHQNMHWDIRNHLT
jgi:hypothetical protein